MEFFEILSKDSYFEEQSVRVFLQQVHPMSKSEELKIYLRRNWTNFIQNQLVQTLERLHRFIHICIMVKEMLLIL
jgi:hypothetical protein